MLSLPDCKLYCYDIHNGKIFYILTQHSLFNRLFHPLLLCKCQRGEEVVDENHECVPITHDEQILRWNRSLKR